MREPLLDAFRAGSGLPSRLAAGGVVVLSLVPGLVVAGKAWLRSHRPPSIRISAGGVRYRRRALTLGAIEEVERVRGTACRLVVEAGQQSPVA